MDIQLEKYTVDFRSITYIDREAEAEAILQSSLPHIQDLSIDLEWDPNGNGQRVDIISIAWRSRMLIIHVSRFKNYSTEGYSGNCLPTLGLILADDHITKFSVNMRCQMRYSTLRFFFTEPLSYQVMPSGCFASLVGKKCETSSTSLSWPSPANPLCGTTYLHSRRVHPCINLSCGY